MDRPAAAAGVGMPKKTVLDVAKAAAVGHPMAPDVQAFLVEAATEFVRMVGMEASEESQRKRKSTIAAEHAVAALDTLGLGGHTKELRAVASARVEDQKQKRIKKKSSQSAISPEERARLQKELFESAARDLLRESQGDGGDAAAAAAPGAAAPAPQ